MAAAGVTGNWQTPAAVSHRAVLGLLVLLLGLGVLVVVRSLRASRSLPPKAIASALPGTTHLRPPPLPLPSAPVDDSYAGLAAEGQRLGHRVIALFPDAPQATALQAGILAEAGDLSAATAAWRAHLDRHPDSAEGWYRLGLYATKEGRDTEAADLLARARRLDPALPDIQGHLGRCLLKLDRVDEAVAVLEPVVGDDRGGAVRLFHLGHAYLALGRHDDAAGAFRAAIDRTPGYTGAWYGLATAAGRAGRDDEAALAQGEFRRLKSRDAATAAANLARDESVRMRQLTASWYARAGRIAALSGDRREAEGMWLRGSEIAPDHAELHALLAELHDREARDMGPARPVFDTPRVPGGSPR